MHDDIRISIRADCRVERSCIGNICLRKPEAITHMKLGKTSFFQGNLIIVIHVVNADDLPALIQQTLCRMKPDKSGGTRYYRFHAGDFFPRIYEVRPARLAAITRRDAAAFSAARKNMVEDIVTSCNSGLCNMP